MFSNVLVFEEDVCIIAKYFRSSVNSRLFNVKGDMMLNLSENERNEEIVSSEMD